MGIVRIIGSIIAGFFIVLLLLAAALFTFGTFNGDDLDKIIRNGLLAVIFISAVMLVVVVWHLERVTANQLQAQKEHEWYQLKQMEEITEQTKLLRFLAKAAQKTESVIQKEA